MLPLTPVGPGLSDSAAQREHSAVEREQIVFVGTSDLSGHFRGKSFPEADLPARMQRGVGLAPSNMFLSAFGPIQVTPFGTRGEVLLIPDASTRVFVPFAEGPAEYFFIGDLRQLDGTAWVLCPREILRRALARLTAQTGLTLRASFEQEFTYSGAAAHPAHPYALAGYRRQGVFGELLLASMRRAGVIPDSFLCEYGPRQFEVTSAPAIGLRAADDAVIVRELGQAIAFRLGERVSFTPIPEPNGTGNGTHIHFSFLDREGRPVLYDDAQPWRLAALGRQFVAGILYHLPAMCGITTPSAVSYFRLRPNRWAPVRADAGALDRGVAVRICPVTGGDAEQRARQFNLEFRVADAAANPYLALALLIEAGLDGLSRGREIDPATAAELPQSLAEAIALTESSELAARCLGSELLSGYVAFKRAELASVAGLDDDEVCRRYGDVY